MQNSQNQKIYAAYFGVEQLLKHKKLKFKKSHKKSQKNLDKGEVRCYYMQAVREDSAQEKKPKEI